MDSTDAIVLVSVMSALFACIISIVLWANIVLVILLGLIFVAVFFVAGGWRTVGYSLTCVGLFVIGATYQVFNSYVAYGIMAIGGLALRGAWGRYREHRIHHTGFGSKVTNRHQLTEENQKPEHISKPRMTRTAIAVCALITGVAVLSLGTYLVTPSVPQLVSITQTETTVSYRTYSSPSRYAQEYRTVIWTESQYKCVANYCSWTYYSYTLRTITSYNTTYQIVTYMTATVPLTITNYHTQDTSPYVSTVVGLAEVVAVGVVALAASVIVIWSVGIRRRRTREVEQVIPLAQKAKTRELAKLVRDPAKPESTKYCRECGAKIPRDSVFCEECGTKLG